MDITKQGFAMICFDFYGWKLGFEELKWRYDRDSSWDMNTIHRLETRQEKIGPAVVIWLWVKTLGREIKHRLYV